jgi:hypothetical protein
MLRSRTSPSSVRISLRSVSVTATLRALVSVWPCCCQLRRLLEEARHLAEHRDVVRVEREDLLVVRLRVVGVAEVLRVPLGEAQAQRDLLRGSVCS